MNLAKQMKHYCRLSFNKSLTVYSHVLLVIKNKGMAFKAYSPVLLFQLSKVFLLAFWSLMQFWNLKILGTRPLGL